MPSRIQRSRAPGWRMPENAVYVGRPTKWGNPFVPGQNAIDEEDAVRRFRFLCAAGLVRDIGQLRGRDLVCWCRLDRPCHADVLLELANG